MSKRRQAVSDAVRRAIGAAGVSRSAICKKTGVDQASISRFMAGKTGLTTATLDRLADVLGLDVVACGPVRVSPPDKPGPKPKKGQVEHGRHRE